MSKDHSIAIIGMGAVFPQSNGLKAYWNLILNGKNAVSDIPENTHWSLKDYFDKNPAAPDHTYCKKGGFLPVINFDPTKYGFPPNNLEATDTSQLLGLMAAEMALADAGYPPIPNNTNNTNNANNSNNTNNIDSVNSNKPHNHNNKLYDHLKTSVILGITGTQELVIPLGARLYHPVWKKALKESGITGRQYEEIIQRISDSFPKWQENSFPGLLGNVVAGRITNRLNLKGTNSVVDAACASSLSAVYTACLELSSGRSDLCVSGGVDTLNDIFMHMCFSKTGVLSHTSDARPFSKDADGTVLSEGIGMVVLKRVEDAKRDNDRIYAVIKGIGTSSDGKTGGIYAPDAGGQLRALKAAYKDAEVNPDTVELFEAHGTGTRVGDKIELTALKSLFMDKNSLKNFAAVGSVKSMIGHAKAAAGAAGLIKAVLSLYHKVIPPTLKADIPDPEIDITNSPFYLNDISKPWVKSDKHPRRCGVSAFGFGGSNFHAVLEEYIENKDHVSWDGSVQIAAFSADTKDELRENILKFRALINFDNIYKDSESSISLDSREQAQTIAWYTLELRKNFKPHDKYRLLFIINENDNPLNKVNNTLLHLDQLEKADQTITLDKTTTSDKNIVLDNSDALDIEKLEIFYGSKECREKIGFLFPGQGSQYLGMGRELISLFPEALETLESAQKIFAETHKKYLALKDYIFPPPLYAQDEKISEENLRSTDIAQPAIGAVSLGMVKILERFGIKPDAACGHSFGEITAFCAAKWIDDKTFFHLASERGKFMAQAANSSEESGSMFAVKGSLDEVEKIIKSENLDLIPANINSPDQTVLSGKTDEIKKAAKIFKKYKLRGVELKVAAAFHSPIVQNAASPFKKVVDKIDINFENSDVDLFSNTTGKKYPKDLEKIKTLLGGQLINPVCFMSNIESMLEHGITTFIEAGPKSVLTGLTNSILENRSTTGIVNSPILEQNSNSMLEPNRLNILKSSKINSFAIDSSSGKKRAVEDLASLLCNLAALGIPIHLDKWEDFAEQPEKKVMRIPLTGANIKPEKQLNIAKKDNKINNLSVNNTISSYRPQQPQQRVTDMKNIHKNYDVPTTAQNQNPLRVSSNNQITAQNENSLKAGSNNQITAQNQNLLRASSNNQTTAQNQNLLQESQIPNNSHLVYSAMQMVQKGMDSMQELQTQTALAHEKFLDTQAAASRTLQSMMEQTRFFAENAIYSQSRYNININAPNDFLYQHHQEVVSNVNHANTYQPVQHVNPADNTNTYQPLQHVNPADNTNTYQPVINKHDNGYVIEKNNGRNNKAVSMPCGIQKSGHIGIQKSDDFKGDIKNIETTLLEIVGGLTGFPVEMLALDMDIESDLGIDSIKRVEIISELEKALPNIDTLNSENMGSLKTLKDILNAISPKQDNNDVPNQYIPNHHLGQKDQNIKQNQNATPHVSNPENISNTENNRPAAPPAHTSSVFPNQYPNQDQDVINILMETISSLTGFPIEMLTPDMDIESDLGIDSIKRVEILSQIEEKLPEAEKISPDDLGHLKTIEQIAQRISKNPKNEDSESEINHSNRTQTKEKFSEQHEFCKKEELCEADSSQMGLSQKKNF